MNIERNLTEPSVITIGMPVFNDVDFIEKSLISILNQTNSNFELIISDDGSTDGSEYICRKFAKLDSRIKYIKQSANLGISKNMQYLLSLCNTKYFMWTGDDDILAPTFIETLINSLENNSTAISAFCTFSYIDNFDSLLSEKQDFDYSNINSYQRLSKFIKNSNDTFGYGIFIAEKIVGVEFPVWWWPNKKCPLNNIYPSLCFYLAKGNYVHNYGESLFFKREKSTQYTNYNTNFSSNGIMDSFAFFLRRFFLIIFSMKMIIKGGGILLAIIIFLKLLFYWFLVPSWKQCKMVFNSFYRKII